MCSIMDVCQLYFHHPNAVPGVAELKATSYRFELRQKFQQSDRGQDNAMRHYIPLSATFCRFPCVVPATTSIALNW